MIKLDQILKIEQIQSPAAATEKEILNGRGVWALDKTYQCKVTKNMGHEMTNKLCKKEV